MHFSTPEAVRQNNFDLFLLLDIAGQAGFSVGYGLENFVTEEDLSAALEAGSGLSLGGGAGLAHG
jgi:hypothetical protein